MCAACLGAPCSGVSRRRAENQARGDGGGCRGNDAAHHGRDHTRKGNPGRRGITHDTRGPLTTVGPGPEPGLAEAEHEPLIALRAFRTFAHLSGDIRTKNFIQASETQEVDDVSSDPTWKSCPALVTSCSSASEKGWDGEVARRRVVRGSACNLILLGHN